MRSRVCPAPAVYGLIGRPRLRLVRARRPADADHGHDSHVARGPAHRRSRRLPRAARPARPAPQRHGIRLPARPRVLHRHPIPDHQPRDYLRRSLQVQNPHTYQVHGPELRVQASDLEELLRDGARRCGY